MPLKEAGGEILGKLWNGSKSGFNFERFPILCFQAIKFTLGH